MYTKPISITIQIAEPSITHVMSESTNDPTIPSFAWKDDKFTVEYSNNVDNLLNQMQAERRTIDIDLMCLEKLSQYIKDH